MKAAGSDARQAAGHCVAAAWRPHPHAEFTEPDKGTEVVVKHFGNGVLLLPADNPWQTLQAGLDAFEPGFVLAREQPDIQQRDEINP